MRTVYALEEEQEQDKLVDARVENGTVSNETRGRKSSERQRRRIKCKGINGKLGRYELAFVGKYAYWYKRDA